MKRLTREFFARYTPEVARELLGCVLVRRTAGGRELSGRIVEVEAYRGRDDPASHSYRGLTKRAALMFGEPGMAYIYLAYGNHWCLNFTTEETGTPGAVLIRALEPLSGIEVMVRNRNVTDVLQLTSGPGKLTRALAIDGSMNGEDIVSSRRLYVLEGRLESPISTSPRIGITVGLEHRWRYFAEGNRFISRGGTHNYRSVERGKERGRKREGSSARP